MKLMSQIFQPIITIPKNAKIKSTEITCKSQKLLLECGMVRPTGPGLFTLLPLARRALDKLEEQVRLCIEAAGAQKVSLPSLTAAALWRATGRLESTGPELMRVTDRHQKAYVLSPTHEEAITDLLADVGPLSYKQLPLLLYQISNKFRDEQRPKHGLLRAREFLMLDAYGAHAHEHCARASYARLHRAYRTLFRRLGLTVHRVSASSGDMGGSLSHEWQLPAPAGEDALQLCRDCRRAELGNGGRCGACGGVAEVVDSVEVGHTFILGSRYSQPLQALAVPSSGASGPLHMSCYGVGVSRLLAASVDALSVDSPTGGALRWPRLAAPYSALVLGPKEGSKEWLAGGWERVQEVCSHLETVPGLTGDILTDDRHGLTIGKRMMQADRSGYPNVVVCGRAALESPPRYELHQPTPGTSPQLGTSPRLLTLAELGRELASSAQDLGPVVLDAEDGEDAEANVI